MRARWVRRLAIACTAGLINSCGGGDATSAPMQTLATPTTSATVPLLSPDVATLARGIDLTMTPSLADGSGKPLSLQGHTVTFATSNAALATVSATGIVHPMGNGAVTITATFDGQQQVASQLTIAEPRTVTGTVTTADGQPVPALVFSARFSASTTSQQTFSAAVDATTGVFSLTMPTLTSTGPSAEFFIDAPANTPRTYHPMWIRLASGFTPSGARIVMIPHSVTPDSGTYKGQKFAVDLNEAFTAVCADVSSANCQSYWPSYFLSGIKNWADASRPVPVAFDRATGPITATDSLTFWDVLRTMEGDLGRSLFKPSAFTSFTTPGYTAGMILVSLDPSLTGYSGYTNWSWDGQGVIYQARVRFSQSVYFSSGPIATHELNHAIGFHHTCRWQTVMGGYGCTQSSRLSLNDVAYYHLAEQVRKRFASFGATWGVAEALAGTRILELGFSTANALPASVTSLFSKTLPRNSDGAP